MKRLLIISMVLATNAAALACGGYLRPAAIEAVDHDPARSAAAIERLRTAGPPGLEALLETHGDWIRRYEAGESFAGEDAATWQRVTAALDAVGRQKDCHASRLFWYTDLAAAKAAAAAAGKPILSLRLLGNLEDELSCANSRFFRTVLYANLEVRRALRERFVLHWASERPAPVVTIDFGDGRVLKRTITGNSVHYVLAADGTVLDAVPGLMAAPVFLAEISRAAESGVALLAEDARAVQRQMPAFRLAQEHVGQAHRLAQQWETAVSITEIEIENWSPDARAEHRTEFARLAAPHALEAAPIAVSKRAVERPTLEALAPRIEALEHRTDDATWLRLAGLFLETSRLDEGSRRLMRSKCRDGESLDQVIARFERSIATDTAFNQFVLHRRIHERLGQPGPAATLDDLNAWVYGDLFLTPRSDPWLGLLPEGTYAALPRGGVVE
jgi:hypothetical protein